VLRTVGVRPTASTFGDVAHHGLGSPNELVCSLAMSPRYLLDDLGRKDEPLNGTLVHMEALETQHPRVVGSPGFFVARNLSSKPAGQVPVQVHVKVNVNVKTCTAEATGK